MHVHLFHIYCIIIYDIVNTILFTSQQKREWRISYFFTIQLSGFMLYPLVLSMLIVPHISHLTYSIYITTIASICLLMLINRCKKLIFMQKYGFLHIFLYLCAFEILPIVNSFQRRLLMTLDQQIFLQQG